MLNNITRSRRSFLRKCALVTIVALFLTLVLYSSLNKIIDRFNYYFNWYNNSLSSLLTNSGFLIDKVVVTGNKFTDKQDILSLVDRTQPILYISLSKFVSNIQSANKWVKYVRINRFLPNTLYINIDEHKPFALWKNDNKTSVIDSEGQVIVDDYLVDDLVVITGQNSLSNLKFIKDILNNKTQLSSHISSCTYIGNSRWNIILDNDSTIKLPEDNPHSAWDYLNYLHSATDFTFGDWSVIDMHVADKIFVKK